MKTISISGVIGWDVTPKDLREGLAEANGEDIELVINSPGGLVSEGIEMFNMVRNYPGQVTARLSGFAMSMASYIPLAASRVVAESNAVYMIHNTHGGVFGDHNYVQKYGKFLESLSRLLARAYEKRTGKDKDEIARMMDDETYFYGDEILTAGFVDEIIEIDSDTDKDGSTAQARAAFTACQARVTADQATMKNDLAKAFALAADHINFSPAGQSAPGNQPTATASAKPEEHTMDLQELKAKHPDLVQAITNEALAGTEEKLTAAQAEGAEAERKRIADVRAQAIPGHEKLIETLAFDGKSTGAEAAQAIVAAEKEARAKAAAAIDGEANKAVAHAAAPEGAEGKHMKRAEFNQLPHHERAEAIKAGVKIID